MIFAWPIARRMRSALLALALTSSLAMVAGPSSSESLAGRAGTDTSLPATDSQVTVGGRGPFAELRITVNQTKNLVNQAVSITWTGGKLTIPGPKTFSGHFMQIMQCWGDDDGTIPENPGPPPEQCVQGATDGVHGGAGDNSNFSEGGSTRDRVISRKTWASFDPAAGYVDNRTGFVWRPFRAVDGKVVDIQWDPLFSPGLGGGSYWLNPYFNIITTNEIAGGRTGPKGEGAELFEVNTGEESSGLGCGKQVEPVAGATPKIPKCWIVIVPRGSAVEENVGTPYADQLKAYQTGVVTSPLSPQAWRNRIAVPLEFTPVDSPCSLTDEQRQIAGNELVIPAVSSWQPALCATPGNATYAYSILSEASARQQLTSATPGAPGMVVLSRPVERAAVGADNPVVYAPIGLSAMVIGFNVERIPKTIPPPDSETLALAGVRIEEIHLTPRLVAKLLTQSYKLQVAIGGIAEYEWASANPPHLGSDPDFLQFNPEFTLLANGVKNFSGLLMSARNSDGARQVWEYLLADPEAKAWLDGAPDSWGMKVNPVYATIAERNAAGAAFGSPVPDSFPKGDPYCYQAPPLAGGSVIPPPLCGSDWLPYTQGLRDAARLTRAADDGAKTALNPLALSSDQVYKRDIPQRLGTRTILSMTDSPSATQYGVQMARLSRAGDNGPDRKFIAPDAAGLTAGVASMTPVGEPAVLEPNPLADAPSAYPLTMLSYAAITPLALDSQARAEYAAFVAYAAGPGQVPGAERGQLPAGYAPLPASLQTQATVAAKTILQLEPLVPTDAPTDAPTEAPVGTPQPSDASGSSESGAISSSPPPVLTSTGSDESEPDSVKLSTTPIAALASSRFALPILAGLALISALLALEITKRTRFAVSGPASAAESGFDRDTSGMEAPKGVMS